MVEQGRLSRREFLQAVAAGAASLPLAGAAQAPATPSNVRVGAFKQVLSPSDFTYLGLFRLPSTQPSPLVRFGFSDGLMTGRRVGSDIHLYITGARPAGTPLYEVRYPGSQSPSLAASPRAAMVRIYGAAVYGGRPVVYDQSSAEYPIVWGVHWDGDKLWWSYSSSYAGAPHNPSIGVSVLNHDGAGSSVPATATSYGPWRTDVHSGYSCGWMLTIPEWFRSAYTGSKTLVIGNPTHSNNATSPFGAAMIAWQPPTLNTPPDAADKFSGGSVSIPTQKLLLHDISHPQARNTNAWVCGNPPTRFQPVFSGGATGNLLDWMDSCCWIDTPTKHGILYLGQLVDAIQGFDYPSGDTMPHNWYGATSCPHGHNGSPLHMATGPGASTVVNYGWIYDPADLALVAQGSLSPWGVSPRHTFRAHTLGGFCQERRFRLYQFGGMFYEQTSGLLFVAENEADNVSEFERLTVVHVFRVT